MSLIAPYGLVGRRRKRLAVPTFVYDMVRGSDPSRLTDTTQQGPSFALGRSSAAEVYDPLWTAQGLYADGTDDNLELDPQADTRFEAAEITWLAVINADELRDGLIFNVRDSVSLRITASGGVRFDMRRPANTFLQLSRAGLVAQKWVVAGLRKGNVTGAKVWLDDLVATNTGETGAIGYNGTNLRVSLLSHINRNTFFKGGLASVHFYNTALSDSDYAKAKERITAEVLQKHGVVIGATGAASTVPLA